MSSAPAVTIIFSPASASVVTPVTMPGVTPAITSGLPALPMPTMRLFLMPMSALTMPASASMISAFVITRSSASPDATPVAWPMPSRRTWVGLGVRAADGAQVRVQARVRVAGRDLAASEFALVAVDGVVRFHLRDEPRVAKLDAVPRRRTEHRAVLSAAQHERLAGRGWRGGRLVAKALLDHARHDLIETVGRSKSIYQSIARDDALVSRDLHQRHRLRVARLESDRRASGDVEPHAVRLLAVEDEGGVCLDEVVVRANLDRSVARVDHSELNQPPSSVQLNPTLGREGGTRGRVLRREVAEGGGVGHGEEGAL